MCVVVVCDCTHNYQNKLLFHWDPLPSSCFSLFWMEWCVFSFLQHWELHKGLKLRTKAHGLKIFEQTRVLIYRICRCMETKKEMNMLVWHCYKEKLWLIFTIHACVFIHLPGGCSSLISVERGQTGQVSAALQITLSERWHSVLTRRRQFHPALYVLFICNLHSKHAMSILQ